jgi:hypothetical protein
MVAFFSAEWADLPVQEYALADVAFEVAFRSLGKFACAVAKRALGA